MITAGPTYEKIDPVRFIGNYSSGKMGFALAEECLRRGADVTLVAGPVSLDCSPAIHRINVESCEEMYQAATAAFASSDNAQKKRVKKNADFIVLNSTRNPGTTFRTDDNQITIISEKGKKEYEKKPKTEVARDIIDELALLF